MPGRGAKPDTLPWLALREAISNMSGPGLIVSARAATLKSARVERSTTRLECLVGQKLQEGREVGPGLVLLAIGGELGRRDVDHLHGMPPRLPVGHLLGLAEVPFLVAAGRIVPDQLLECLVIRGGFDAGKILDRHCAFSSIHRDAPRCRGRSSCTLSEKPARFSRNVSRDFGQMQSGCE